MESTKTIRTRQIKELAAHSNTCKENGVIVAGDFNESMKSDNVKSFMNEAG